MKHTYLKLAGLALLNVITISSVWAAKDPEFYNPSQAPAAAAKQYLKVTNPKEFKGVKRVVIPHFQVQYILKSHGSAFASNVDAGNAQVSRTYAITGVSDAELQALTDRLYANTVADLKAIGIEVVPVSEIAEHKEYKALLADFGKPAPYELEAKNRVSRTFAPTGNALYFDVDDPSNSFGSTFGGMFGAVGKQIPIYRENHLRKETGIPVLRMRYIVDFANLKTKKSGVTNASGSKASVNANFKMALVFGDRTSGVLIDSAYGGAPNRNKAGQVWLDKPFISGEQDWLLSLNEVNAGANRAKSIGTTALTVGLGGKNGTTTSIKEYEVGVDSTAYAAAVEKLVADANRMFLVPVAAAK